ncbi:MAG: redoxin domain-containing protein, partial [Pedobacter sp.]
MLLFSIASSFAQKQLKIGDTIPDLYISGFLNHPGTQLSTLHKDGLLIINFWATWCGPCLRELPVLDSAVNESKGKLHVISTSYEPIQAVTSFLQNRKDIPTSHLRLLPADTLLHQLFPHRLIPHNIWVDNKGIIRHISGSEGINRKNIDEFLQGNTTSVQEKKDVLDFDYRKPFHLRDSSFAYRSIFTDYNPGIGAGILYFTILKKEGTFINRIFMWNQTINKLYLAAYSNMQASYKDTSLTEIITKDSLRFFWPKLAPMTMAASKYKTEEDWQKEHLYTYELILKKPVRDTLAFKYMMDDLNRNFEVKTAIKLRKRPCLVISTQSKKPVL